MPPFRDSLRCLPFLYHIPNRNSSVFTGKAGTGPTGMDFFSMISWKSGDGRKRVPP